MIQHKITACSPWISISTGVAAIRVPEPVDLLTFLWCPIPRSRSGRNRLTCVGTNANPARLAVDCAWNALPSLNDLEIDLIDVALARPPFRRLDGRQEFVIRFKPGEGSQLCLV